MYPQIFASLVSAFDPLLRKDLLIITFGALVVFAGLVGALKRKHNRQRIPLPPGPRRYWLVGNAFDFPRLQSWKKFTEWRDQYGDIVYAEAFGKPIVILNTLEAVNDLLDKRASQYTNRPTLIVVGEMMAIDQGMPMQRYGPGWKKQRRLVNQGLSIAAVKKYHNLQSEITAIYLNSLVDNPSDFAAQLRLATGRIVMNVTYGLSAKTPDSLYITEAEECMYFVNRSCMPGAFLVDLVPALRNVPFLAHHKAGREGYARMQRLINRPFLYAQKQIENGTARPSLTLDCVENYSSLNEKAVSDEEKNHTIRWAAGCLYAAGGETTYAATMSFILACLYFPEVLKKAQAEVDSVVGAGRLPTLQDRPSLPYIEATVKETLRWRPVLPISVPREADEADVYNGYFIPEKSLIVPNIWAISQDNVSGIPTEHFAPERHMSEHVKTVATDPFRYAFGFGRRVCPGRNLGENSVYILISAIVATMNITPAKDTAGREILPDPEYAEGLVAYAKSFPVHIAPRSEGVANLIREIVNGIEPAREAEN
ncbi:cytochrome P450 [Mycena galopus ATCC 62051]|nr:cytochrome P450 [Mycena galopus ATCC 62051]